MSELQRYMVETSCRRNPPTAQRLCAIVTVHHAKGIIGYRIQRSAVYRTCPLEESSCDPELRLCGVCLEVLFVLPSFTSRVEKAEWATIIGDGC